MTNGLTVSEIIDQRPLSRFQTSTMILCGLVLVLDGFDAQSIGFLASSMAKTLHTPVSTFGPVFSAALVGLMISAMIAGPIADRWGRKWPVVFCTLMFATFSFLTARAHSYDQLLVFRFLTGLGLGGAIPNVVALTSEYAPKRLMSIYVSMLFCGIPLGALLGGIVSAVMLPRWGWQPVFYVGGVVPFVVALFLIKILPESVRFLTVSGADPQRIRRIMSQIAPDLGEMPVGSLSAPRDLRKGIPVTHLFTEGRAIGTMLLWIPYFMNLLIIYFIVSWLPSLLQQSAMPVSAGILAVSLFSLAGIVGSLMQGRMMNRYGAYVVLGTEFGISTLLIASLAFSTSLFLTMAVTFILGFAIEGAQAGLNAVVAAFYPTFIRSTGVGWALGVGRIGSIVGPLIAGFMLTMGEHPRQIFLAGAIPALCAGVAIALNGRMVSNSTARRPDLKPDIVS